MDRMTRAGTAPMATYPINSSSLYLQVDNWHSSLCSCFCFKQQCTVCCKHSGTGVWFQVNCVKSRTHGAEGQRERLCYLSWKKKTYMDPTQAMTQINQRIWHVHGPSSLSISLGETHHTYINIYHKSFVVRLTAV